jgi:Asp-tRNA(Asn)/Glu-tRNA(Gln) amidotransferase A subunit family amidase
VGTACVPEESIVQPGDLCFLSAAELAAAIRVRTLSPREVVDAILERIEVLNPLLNAYCTLTADQARRDARAAEDALVRGDPIGPLHGVPVSIKDLIFTRGVRTTRGSAVFADFVPTEDSPAVERLKRAGAIVLGKTNTPEFGWKGATDNRVFGPTRNPWDLSRTPGGSSGGSAAAVAAGLGPLSLGTDGAGSIRIPSSFCGTVGIKPSFGRVPYYPPSASDTLSHQGPIARTVADAALMLSVIAGPDERDRHSLPRTADDFASAAREPLGARRIAWSADLGYVTVDVEVRTLAEAAARRFASDLGCEVEEAAPGFSDPLATVERIFHGSIGASLAGNWPEWRDRLDPGLVAVVEQARGLSGFDIGQANLERQALWERVRRFFERYDLLLTPTLPIPAFPVGLDSPRDAAGRPMPILGWTPFTFPFNLTGQPAASVPCGWTAANLPVGLQIVGRRLADAEVIRAAAAFGRVAPWHHRRPPVAEPGVVPS